MQEGTRTPVAISVFVKNPEAAEHGRIFFHDIGDYLDQKQKLAVIQDFGAIDGITNTEGWDLITPDDQNDWLKPSSRRFLCNRATTLAIRHHILASGGQEHTACGRQVTHQLP